MISAGETMVPATPAAGQRAALAVLAVGVAVLAASVFRYWLAAATAARFPFELDYGEGIVWQQMILIFSGQGYGRIDGWPAIVFHYPPVFHAATWLASRATGADPLLAGRAVSLGSTLACAAIGALIVAGQTRAHAGRAGSWACGLIAFLLVFMLQPVRVWAPLMRVDMLATALGLAGLLLAGRSFARPHAIYPAALCFVAAVFTKQTAIAAPAAAFLLLLWLRPATALRGIATAIGAGLIVLGALSITTHGGFVRHIFLYNINRFDLSRLAVLGPALLVHLPIVGAAALGLGPRLAALRERHGGRGARGWRDSLAADPADAAYALLLAYAATATPLLLLVAKSGSNINYLVEWFVVAALFAGVAAGEAAAAAAGRAEAPRPRAAVVPLLLAGQALMLPGQLPYAVLMSPQRQPALLALSGAVREADKPVSSDDMVLLLRSGKSVQWEPAIFAELASVGVWDQQPLVRRIRERRFAFLVTVGHRGEPLYDSRYTPAVADAIDAAYPVQRKTAGYLLHLPAGSAR